MAASASGPSSGSDPGPTSLIVNSPFVRPDRHWLRKSDESLELAAGRRPAAYDIFDPRTKTLRVVPLETVNQIRERVEQWQAAGRPGITSLTRRLLEHWHDPEARPNRLYFCQLEAVETLIWWVEGAEEYRRGVRIPDDGGPWERLCSKMATGTGKTTLMAMIITWQALNALTYPRRRNFSPDVFIVAPGLTVKDRLRVLQPGEPDNYYDAFVLCPSESLRQKLNQARVLVENWHTLMPLKEPLRSVVRKGPESDEAFARRVLGPLAAARDIVVINDEAHHAYRRPPEVKISKAAAAEMGLDLDEATRWIEGLDRIHKTRRIRRCFDLSATPFAPTGKKTTESALFEWCVSDFGLNDAIEAGLVKTPRVVVRDGALPDTKTLRPKLYHIYRDPAVSQDLNRARARPEEPLPKLVQDAYTLLAADWREARSKWAELGHPCPPVLLTVCNRTETAARIEHYFNHGHAHWPELHDPGRTLRVDSTVLEKAEMGETARVDKDYEARLTQILDQAGLPVTVRERLSALKKEDLLRHIVDSVGRRGGAGAQLQNVISVAMLSEGWDAKNVTHIMGLRAFTSQLLCEQVIGRGLRRVSHELDENGRFKPEYVNVFGVPLSIFEQAGEGDDTPKPPKPSTQVEAAAGREALEIRWPNIVRIETVVRPVLHVDWDQVQPLSIDPAGTPITADLAPALSGAANMGQVREINLELLPEGFRLQRLIFQAASKAFATVSRTFRGRPEYLIIQLIRIVEAFLDSDRLTIPTTYHSEPMRKRILLALNMDLVVQHLMRHVQEQNQERLSPVYDADNPIAATGQMRPWYTTRPAIPTIRSHISHVVGDAAWEQYAANVFEKSPLVAAYAKNDHLDFQIHYLWEGSRRRYLPDFLVRLTNDATLVLEIKGQDSPQTQAKHAALDQWTRAVNAAGGFGRWRWAAAFAPAEVHDIVARHGGA